MNGKKLAALFLAMVTGVVTGIVCYYIGYENGQKAIENVNVTVYTTDIVDFTCSVYSDRSMCCTPIFKFKNIKFAYKHPFQANATQTYICHYNLTAQRFQKCEPLNVSFKK